MSQNDAEAAGSIVDGLMDIIQFIVGMPVAIYAFFEYGHVIEGTFGSLIVAGAAYAGTGIAISVVSIALLIVIGVLALVLFAIWKVAGSIS